MTTKLPDARSQSIEAWLQSFGVDDWEFDLVELGRIDDAASRNNQARIEVANPDTIEQYTLAALGGAVFPPLVLARVGPKLVTIDGNHRRLALMDAGVSSHPAYIVGVPATVRDLLTLSANTANGLPRTDLETRQMILKLHERGAFTYKQIANLVGATERKVSLVARAAEARRRASDTRAVLTLSDDLMEVIGRASSDPVLDMLVANQMSVAPLPFKDVRTAVSKSNKERSDAARAAVVEDAILASRRDAVQPSRRSGGGDYGKLQRGLGLVMHCNPTNVVLDTSDRDLLLKSIDEATVKLAEIADAL